MIEVYRDTSERLTLTILVGGIARDADTGVTVTVTRQNGEVVFTGPATKVPATVGRYFWDMPLALTREDGHYDVTWTFTVAGEAGQSIDHAFVVTPYIDYDTFVGRTGSDMTYEEFRRREPIARGIIDAYTGQRFGKYSDTIRVFGLGGNRLPIQLPVLRVDSIYPTNAQSVAIMPNSVIFPSLADTWEIKFDTIYTKHGGRFIDGVEYAVTGLFGYHHVPSPVILSAALLIQSQICVDNSWRQKGIEAYRAADWRLEFHDKAFEGTGNIDVDLLLNQYRAYKVVII